MLAVQSDRAGVTTDSFLVAAALLGPPRPPGPRPAGVQQVAYISVFFFFYVHVAWLRPAGVQQVAHVSVFYIYVRGPA